MFMHRTRKVVSWGRSCGGGGTPFLTLLLPLLLFLQLTCLMHGTGCATSVVASRTSSTYASSSATAATRTTTTLKKDAWQTITLGGGSDGAATTSASFVYTTKADMKPCTTLEDCIDSDRFVQIIAHSTTAEIHVELRMGTSTNRSSVVQASHGYNVGLVSRYGVWSNTYGEECVSSQSRWRPLPLHDTAYITLRLNNVSAATAGGQIHTVGLLAHSANIQAPVPGACASTGVLEYNSMVESSVEDEVVALAFQQSDMGITREKCDFDECGEHTCNCDFVVDSDKKEGGTLKYELYSAAATSCGSDFHHDIGVAEVMVTLGKMSTLAGAKKFGTLYNGVLLPEQVKAFEVDEATGQGIVYTIVVTDEFQAKQNPQLPQETFQSIYTPVHSFGCIPEGMASPPGSESLPACAGLTSYSLLIVRVLTGLLGIYMGLYGHRHYYGMAFISFTLVGTGAAYATLGWASGTSILGLNLSYAALMPLSLLAGLLLAALLYAAWIQFDLMGVYAVFQGAVMGFVLAAFLMATPLGEVDIFAIPFNYAMVYSCVVLFTPLLFLIRSRPISLASTSFVGAYCTLLPFDFFLGSDFDAIVGNVFRRATDPTFAKAYSGHYFADDFNGCTNVAENAGFFAAWCALTLLYLALQLMCTARGVRVPTSALGAPTPRSLWRSLWLQRAIVRSKSPEELRSLLSPPPPSARHGSIQDYPRAWEDGSSGSQSE